jgi:CheY-like chemotaxis protein
MDEGVRAPVPAESAAGPRGEGAAPRDVQDLQAAGRVAGSVAKELNDLLTVIAGRSYMLLGHLSEGGALRREIELIERAAQRAVTLVQQMLAFSWRQALARQVVDMRVVLGRAQAALRPLLGERVELVVRLGDEPCPVSVDPEQLDQVLAQVIRNARDAMPMGGSVTVETRAIVLGEPGTRAAGGPRAGRYVSLRVSDTGTGMDEATRSRAVEPFFTTKGAAWAAGLGLSTVLGIVRQSGGDLSIASEEGRGTTVTVLLPWAGDAEESDQPAGVPAETPGASETVLLAEDEDEVRELTADILTRAGYTVIQAANGALALERARRHQGPIHVLVTDLVMPTMNGRELARRLKLMRHEIRVLYVSGYVRDEAAREAIAGEDAAFLPKPFTPTALIAAVSALLVPHR